MEIIALIISSVALILSGYALYRSSSKPDAQPPTVGAKGAGGGGRR